MHREGDVCRVLSDESVSVGLAVPAIRRGFVRRAAVCHWTRMNVSFGRNGVPCGTTIPRLGIRKPTRISPEGVALGRKYLMFGDFSALTMLSDASGIGSRPVVQSFLGLIAGPRGQDVATQSWPGHCSKYVRISAICEQQGLLGDGRCPEIIDASMTVPSATAVAGRAGSKADPRAGRTSPSSVSRTGCDRSTGIEANGYGQRGPRHKLVRVTK